MIPSVCPDLCSVCGVIGFVFGIALTGLVAVGLAFKAIERVRRGVKVIAPPSWTRPRPAKGKR